MFADPLAIPPALRRVAGATEAEALVAALEAAPREVAAEVDRLSEAQRAADARLSAEVQAVRADVMVLRVQQGPPPAPR